MSYTRRDVLLNGSVLGLATAVPAYAAKSAPAAPSSMADGQVTAEHPLSRVPIAAVTIDDPFWSPKRRTWCSVTIPDCLDKFDEDRGGAFANFDKVAAGRGGSHAGDPWMDGLVYEMIRGAADFLLAEPDPKLARRLEAYAKRIAAAAAVRSDGYLNTYTQLVEPGHEWGDNGGLLVWQHEIYNIGALIDAGIHLYRATGSTTLLVPAIRIANTMDGLMGPPPRRNIVPAHPLPEEALVRLHELCVGEPALESRIGIPVRSSAYLRLAEFWIESRGHNSGTPDWEKDRPSAERFVREGRNGDVRPSWGSYAQDHAPVFEQQTIEGHAVRATLLCAGVAAAAWVNGDERYRLSALRLWENMVQRRMHITGGVGAYALEEKFGQDFMLPNDAYLETCAAAGAGFFHHNMNMLFGHARYADELERVLYNGVLSGVSLDGNTYLYQNPLEADRSRSRWAWHSCPCCPPMFLKLMGMLPELVYATDDRAVYVNLFIGGRADITMPQGSFKLRQVTRYPWDGRVQISVEDAPDAPLSMMVRVPAWCRSAALTVNGAAVDTAARVRGYVGVNRKWRPGDTVILDLKMPVERVRADPRVKSDQARVALMRGPLVYCIEACDVRGSGVPFVGHVSFSPRFSEILGGAIVLDGAVDLAEPKVGHLYGTGAMPAATASATAIPYYANLNRGPVDMAVWHPIPT